MDGQQPLKKPRNVILAVRLIYVTLVISVLSFLFWSVLWLSGLWGEVQVPVCAFTLLLLVTVGMFYLASMISKGRKWARAFFTALVVLELLNLMCSFSSLAPTSPTPRDSVFSSTDPYTLARISALFQTSQNLSSIASTLISIVAVLLLYRRDSSDYFVAADQRKQKIEPNDLHDGSETGPDG